MARKQIFEAEHSALLNMSKCGCRADVRKLCQAMLALT